MRLLLPLAMSFGLVLAGCDDGGEALIPPDTTEPIDHPPPLPAPPCNPLPQSSSFVKREGSRLMLDGQPFRAVGANLYYLQHMFAYGELIDQRYSKQALDALDQATCLGARTVRFWAFNDTADKSQIRSGPRDEDYKEVGLQALDRAVAEAKARGLRMILTLTNNYSAYGGLCAYTSWVGRNDDGECRQHDDFYSDPLLKGFWKDYVTRLANRTNTITGIAYRDEPAIVAWELGNELRCPSCRGSSRYIDTIRELARHAKTALPNHLIADGGDGFDDVPSHFPGLSNSYAVRGDEGVSFTKLLAVDELDMVSYHMYPGMRPDMFLEAGRDVQIWISNHERLARAAGKVAYLGEFGHPVGAKAAPDESAALTFNSWLSLLFARNDGQMGLLWQMVPEPRLASAKDGNDGFAVAYTVHKKAMGVLLYWADRVQ